MAREKELRNFFGNVVTALRETDDAVAARGPLGCLHPLAGDSHCLLWSSPTGYEQPLISVLVTVDHVME